jgi:hypothetical protein
MSYLGFTPDTHSHFSSARGGAEVRLRFAIARAVEQCLDCPKEPSFFLPWSEEEKA